MISSVPTGQPGPSEQDYLDAARAYWAGMPMGYDEQNDARFAREVAELPAFRAAVDSAFAAGWRARVPEGGVEMEEFATQFAHRSDWDHGSAFVEVYEDRDEAERLTDYMASLGDRPARTMRRVAIYGPWSEVPSDLSRETNPASTERGTT